MKQTTYSFAVNLELDSLEQEEWYESKENVNNSQDAARLMAECAQSLFSQFGITPEFKLTERIADSSTNPGDSLEINF